MGIYVFVVQMRWIAVRRDLTWMNMDREDAGASLGVLPRCMGYAPPCGYCLKASMTG